MIVPDMSLVDIKDGRGGAYTEWLVEELMKTTTKDNRQLARQMAPPVLYKEGIKVQTPWLYSFLLEPHKIRHTTVLRMPQFNMSTEEAQSLANYFAAVDGVPYPYQDIIPRDPDYIAARQAQYHDKLDGETYLSTSWKALNGPLCMKCHVVAGRELAPPANPAEPQIRGPNLEGVSARLRPEWTELWLYKPAWITPYTSMPVNYPADKPPFDLFDSDTDAQVIGTRDALMNYQQLLENLGKVDYQPAPAATSNAAAALPTNEVSR